MLSFFSQRKYSFCHQNTLFDAFRTNSRNVTGRNSSMVIPLLANQDLTPMLLTICYICYVWFSPFVYLMLSIKGPRLVLVYMQVYIAALLF